MIDHALGDFVVSPRDLWEAAKELGRTDLMDPWHGETGLLDNGLLNAFRLTSLTWEQMAADLTVARAADPKATPWQVAGRLKGDSLHHSVAPFHERIGYTLSLRGYDLAEELGLACTSLVQELADRIRPLQDRALCMPTAIAKSMLLTEPARTESKKRRGRRELLGGTIKQMVHEEFGPRLLPGGNLYGLKKHSVRHLAMAWIKAEKGVEVAESTMRDYLAPLHKAADGKSFPSRNKDYRLGSL